jgi:hypothetical protein
VRRAAVIALVLASIGLAAAPAPALSADPEGRLHLVRNARSDFDRFITGSSPSVRTFIRGHYWRMRGYPPFFDQALRWAPPTDFYADLYALHPSLKRDRRLVARHPDWVLRNAAGRKLYIPWNCDGRRCSAWAADPGNRAWRARWIGRARAQLAKGYAGVYIDNVNMELRVSDGSGREVAPIDPRTGRPMQLADWRRYVAGFTEAIRAALPRAEIVHNVIWFAGQDKYVAREVQSTDVVEFERGCSDSGLVAGPSRFGFETFLSQIDWVHSRNVSVVLEPYGDDPVAREYNLACYLLVSSGGDAIASDFETDPGEWWSGWGVDLGIATGFRYPWNGLWRRDFADGIALLNQPGQPAITVQLPGLYRDLSGNLVAAVTLGAAQGTVLRRVL